MFFYHDPVGENFLRRLLLDKLGAALKGGCLTGFSDGSAGTGNENEPLDLKFMRRCGKFSSAQQKYYFCYYAINAGKTQRVFS
jgi:hypothetical protein